MAQAPIIDIRPRLQPTCKHVWMQGQHTGTGWQYQCSRCGAYGYRSSYKRAAIKAYTDQGKARDYVKEVVRQNESWKEPEPDEEPTWDDLRMGQDEWIEPDPERDR